MRAWSAPAPSRTSVGQLHAEVVQRDFVVVPTHEHTNASRGERGVLDSCKVGTVDGERELLTDGAHRQVVGRAARSHAGRSRPRHQVYPTVAIAAPDAVFAEIPGLHHVRGHLLVDAIPRLGTLVADDQ